MVKTSSPPELQFIPFEESPGVRVYKGEGIINLIAFYPYAIGIEEQNIIIQENSSDGLNVGEYGSGNKYVKVYNKGDFDCPFKLYYQRPETNTAQTLYCALLKTTTAIQQQDFSQIEIIKSIKIEIPASGWLVTDTQICIDMRTHLIEGINSSGQRTGNLYNYAVTEGDFFDLSQDLNILIWNKSGNTFNTPYKIMYNELYY